MASNEEKLAVVRKAITDYQDFPRKGVLFRNIFPVLSNPAVFKQLIELMTDHLRKECPNVQVIVGLESRGFLFGPIIAQNLNIGFVPIRKKGKLPGEKAKITYSLEYGEDTFEIQTSSVNPGDKVVVIDDLLATGGTMKAAFDLLEIVKADVLEGFVIMELTDLKGRSKSENKKIVSLIQY